MLLVSSLYHELSVFNVAEKNCKSIGHKMLLPLSSSTLIW